MNLFGKQISFSDHSGNGYSFSKLLTLEIPIVIQVLISLISFLIILLLSKIQSWRVNELVWSLWISSLSLGYTFLISAIVSSTIHTVLNSDESENPDSNEFKSRNALRWVFTIFGGIFMVLFFTVHFGMFHFIHGIFLNMYFPLIKVSPGDLPNFVKLIKISLNTFWPVILLSLVLQIKNFQQIILFPGKDLLTKPYKNVVKMHLTILLFAFLSMAKINEIFFPYLLILYFFPLQEIYHYLRNRKNKQIDKIDA